MARARAESRGGASVPVVIGSELQMSRDSSLGDAVLPRASIMTTALRILNFRARLRALARRGLCRAASSRSMHSQETAKLGHWRASFRNSSVVIPAVKENTRLPEKSPARISFLSHNGIPAASWHGQSF